MQWICDVAELVRNRPDIDLDQVINQARKIGAERMLMLGLGLGHVLIGCGLPVWLIEAVRSDARPQQMVTEVIEHLFDVNYQPTSVFVLSRFRVCMRERLRDKISYVARTLLTPRVMHVRMVRLPRLFRLAYIPLKVSVDYVVLPLRGMFMRPKQKVRGSAGSRAGD